MVIRAQVYCRKEENHWDPRGHIYCWYYRVYDASTRQHVGLGQYGQLRAHLLGILKKSRGW